jgi:3-oxoacyl-[acyl-carrier-protein] synthase-1
VEETTQPLMTVLLSDNIISALGFTTEENYRNVKAGKSGLTLFDNFCDIPEPFMSSEINGEALNARFEELLSDTVPKYTYTKLEKACIVSASTALRDTGGIDVSGKRVLFILSTTKGNIFLLDKNESGGFEHEQLYLWRSAELIAGFFGNENKPLVISNACISGASALVAAQREIHSGRYDYAVVTGVDMLSKFIVTGFQSFKALSAGICRPFDAGRQGLNIGEAAATMILAASETIRGEIEFVTGAIRNDANHISGPSRTGEGAYLALRKVLESSDAGDLAFVNAHGTATPYNDEMEAVALTRAGLQNIPVNSLKGYFGHTLGAAGILESIISCRALTEGTILRTYGFETLGVANPLNVTKENMPTNKNSYIKLLSGFGGCNIATLFRKS